MSSEYATQDMHLTCFLVAKGHRLLRLEDTDDRRRVSFIFPEEVAGEVPSYFNGAALPVRLVLTTLRDIKALVIEHKRRGVQR